MEEERNEVYERIPWETLEKKSGDRQWLLLAVAGAVVLGALAYSFMSNRPVATPATTPTPGLLGTATVPTVAMAPQAAEPPPVNATPEPSSPVVMAEADLYAVDPKRWLDLATAHAEWFVAEYFTVDGSDESAAVLAGLLPEGVPPPENPTDSTVFVEWVRTMSIEEVEPLRFRVSVLVRSLKAGSDNIYHRQAPLIATVEVVVDMSGPRVALPPAIDQIETSSPENLALVPVPPEVTTAVTASVPEAEVIGGIANTEGNWQVVVMAPGPDGIRRPQTVTVP